jgi:hypothetical protein
VNMLYKPSSSRSRATWEGVDFKEESLSKKLVNRNENADRIFLLIYCGELYQWNFLSLHSSVNTNGIFLLVYIGRIAVVNKK